MRGWRLPPASVSIGREESAMLITSEIAGSVWKIEAPVGSTVAAGAALVILESMKMEIPVEAPCAGRVAELLVSEGQAIAEGQALLRFDPA
jgi:acetyl-CoA carboxylase biotin carboxyl carrier protein